LKNVSISDEYTATVSSRITATWPLRRTIQLGAKDAFVQMMAAASCDFLFQGAMYKSPDLFTYLAVTSANNFPHSISSIFARSAVFLQN